MLKFLVLPVYRSVITTKLKFHRLALPARGFVLFLITNRYLIHLTVTVMAIVSVTANLQTRQALAQDIGSRSLLFAMATNQRNEIVEENLKPEAFIKSSNYLGSATVVGIPHIDFDYQEIDPIIPTLSIPGTIAALPTDTTEETSIAPRTKTENYTVKENDTISTIAQNFHVNIGTILWNNNLSEKQYIRPGDILKIPPVSGVLVTVKKGDTLLKLASNYSANATEIASFNNIEPDDPLDINTELMIPGGSPPQIVQIHAQIATRTEAISTSPLGNITKPPDLDTKDTPKTRLLWPTSGHVITQYYGWKHTGLDIDGDYTSPLYAAADGVVEKAGWNSGGYGLMILLDHGGGTKTRYGHASKIFVKEGERVKRGQVIAMMGTTGRSTGTHLHFEVYINNKRVNPLSYIK
ncbi:MAG: peptidoglycan DD-metalloendopeptidase family protein [Patescibacteria group bacterium]